MPFTYEKKEVKGEVFAELTGYAGETSVLRVPEEIDGLSVLSIAGNAFSWREDIKEAILPERLRTLRGFAFYNSGNLKKISLYDGVEDYHDGVIRHCRSLSEIRIEMRQGNYALIKAMLGDNDRCLRLFLSKEGQTIRLTFPDYFSDYIEDTRARAFHTKIEGAGYRYRECVTKKGILFQEYDEIFIRASSYDTRVAAQIATDRLMTPFALSDAAIGRYRTFLRENMGQVLPDLIRNRDEEVITFLAQEALIPQEVLEAGIRLASETFQPAVCARLMDAQKEYRKPTEAFVL